MGGSIGRPCIPTSGPPTLSRHFYEGNLHFAHKNLWHQILYMVLALFYWPVNMVISGMGMLVGPADSTTHEMNLLLYGRVMICLLGALNVWAVYRLFKRVQDSTPGAIMAAAILAVSPLLVAQSHYHTVDIPLALSITFALWSAVYMMQQGRWWPYLLAGLVFGLAVTTKVNAIVVIGSFALAHVLGTLQHKTRWPKWALAQPGLFAVGGVAGLVVGYPELHLWTITTSSPISSSTPTNG